MNKRSGYNLAKSFLFAFSGIARSLKYERNLRIHFLSLAYIVYFTRYFELSMTDCAVLAAVIGGVIACELINTAIEACVDLHTVDYNVLAKIAKDAAAGAVLVSAAVSLVVGAALFWQPGAFAKIWADIALRPLIWLFLLLITVFLIAWPEYRMAANGNNHVKNNNVRED